MASRLATLPRLLVRPRHVTSYVRCSHARLFATETKQSDPLRILFCGSDAFSCASLRALHKEHTKNKALIESLEVMVLPGKKTGRGLKVVSEVPCKSLAQDLGLAIHQRPTFRDWDLPEGTNIIIAVSFGLFVPVRILQSAKYGGLNIHPSLLPDLRGPAPIHHALLNGNTHTGVSLQTLHPTTFDHGAILAQTPLPGIPIPSDTDITSLTSSLALVGAEMLVQGLRDGVHVAPQSAIEQAITSPIRHAPKVQKSEAGINWTWAGDEWCRRRQVFGSLWTTGKVAKDGVKKRVIFTELGVVPSSDGMDAMRKVTVQIGNGLESRLDERTGDCYLPLPDGCWVRVGKVLVDGKKEQVATTGLRPFFSMA